MPDPAQQEILIIGGGIGGLTLGLMLEGAGISCRIYESAPELRPIGVGINLLPHAMKELGALGLEDALAAVGVTTARSAFFNRFGQLIYDEPLGRAAGFAWPQISIHRGDLQQVLADAFIARAGADRLRCGWVCAAVEQDASGAVAHFRDPAGAALRSQRGSVVIACDGIHSVVRKQLHPGDGEPLYSGVNMWRGVTKWPSFLGGATMLRAGWLRTGKMVIYPIRNGIDGAGRQLVNWVFEIETPHYKHRRDWTRPGRLEDFVHHVADWRFDWLDVPAFLAAADYVLEYPMVDQDPLERWSFGRVTLLGDAAHPMLPRGSNGAGQAILDCAVLTEELVAGRRDGGDPAAALLRYEARRRDVTAAIVRTNRTTPPDAILREVFERTGDKPFVRVEDVISRDELVALSDGYKRVTGSDKGTLQAAR